MNIDNNAAQALNRTWDHTVTFTLTPDNANDIPMNVVHLIVAEGVTEIPAELCYRGYDKGIESLETIVFSKSVTIIGRWAFRWCINLRSVMFSNDSQLREIGNYAFQGCKSLQSIAIPDSVTTIGQLAFCKCTNLKSVFFSEQSRLQKIGNWAFCDCRSLQSIIIPKSVIDIGEYAFAYCSKLKSVIFAEHSSIQTINRDTFSRCKSLQFINIPTTVTTINAFAFWECPVLQVIDIPHQAVVDPAAFDDCPLLRTTLEEHGADCMKDRFDELPIHQICYKFNNNTSSVDIINTFQSLQHNDPDLLQVDIMGMIPLHILCANPGATKTMIYQLYLNNTEAAAVRNVNDMLSWHIYAVNKDRRFRMFNEIEDIEDEENRTDTTRMILSNEFDADTLVDANVDIGTKEMYLILTGSSLGEWLETINGVTGLYPFMSMATKSSNYNLEDVYDVAMMNLNSILQKELSLSNSKRSSNECTTDRHSKTMKRV
jgi:hypothetical protein